MYMLGNTPCPTILLSCWPGDSAELRKRRGAFFTPYAIAEHLAEWALRAAGNEGLILDPTCGEDVFLLAAAEQLARKERPDDTARLFGVDIHDSSFAETRNLLSDVEGGPESDLQAGDFFEEPTRIRSAPGSRSLTR
jgi:adenine-specific DNA-methyltransferase